MTRLTPVERETARQLVATGWPPAKIAHAMKRRRARVVQGTERRYGVPEVVRTGRVPR